MQDRVMRVRFPRSPPTRRPRLGGRASRCQREGWDSISHGRSRGSGDAQDRRGGAFEVCAGEPRRSPGHKVSRAYSSTVERAVYNCVIVGSTPRAPTSFHAVRPGVRLGSYPDLGAFDSRRRNQFCRGGVVGLHACLKNRRFSFDAKPRHHAGFVIWRLP